MKQSFLIHQPQMASTTSEIKITENFKESGCAPSMIVPRPCRLIKAEYWCFNEVYFFFCASIGSFRILKKAGEWRLKSLFLLLQKSDGETR